MAVTAVLFAVTATPLVVTTPRPGSATDALSWSALGIASVVGALLIYRSFGKLATLRILRWPQLLAHYVGRGYAVLAPVAVGSLILVLHSAPDANTPTSSADLVRMYGIDFGIGFLALSTALEGLRYRHLRSTHPPQALDAIMLELHSVAARIGWSRRSGEWSNASARDILSSLEALAWTAEYYPPLAVRVPLADAEARALARGEGAKLAAMIRKHKGPVLNASEAASSGLKEVETSLCRDLIAWSGGNWAALTEHAPDVAVPRRWFRFWQRLWPAAVLAIFAFTLPLIDAFNVGQVGSSIRISLLVAAALSVVTGGVPVADRVQGTVDRSLGWRSSEDQ